MIILIRHGEATHHTQKLTGGWTDSELTAKGRNQIRAAAVKLALDFDGRTDKLRILASDLQRAAESARICAEALDFRGEVEYCKFLREKNNGVAAGLTEEEAKSIFVSLRLNVNYIIAIILAGETRCEFYDRNIRGLWQCADVEKENLLIVAHKGTIQNIIFKWLGMNMQQVVDFNYSVDISPASITILGINKWHEHTIFRLNDVGHLQTATGFGILISNTKRNKNLQLLLTYILW